MSIKKLAKYMIIPIGVIISAVLLGICNIFIG